jgi:sugar phosphate isomerase/epimerase
MQSLPDLEKTPLRKGLVMPRSEEEWGRLSQTDRADIQKAIAGLDRLPNTLEEQKQRVRQEADRINALVRLAAVYGAKVELYNHNGWFGMMNNQIAVIDRLRELGVTDVGIVYNFNHARDDLHDDTVNFRALWNKIKPYVVAVNITGTQSEGPTLYPSQGDRELQMMRIIQENGWSGPVGVVGERVADAEVTLRNCLVGFDWLVAELHKAGSGGPRPFR